jgi:hypothetical protein
MAAELSRWGLTNEWRSRDLRASRPPSPQRARRRVGHPESCDLGRAGPAPLVTPDLDPTFTKKRKGGPAGERDCYCPILNNVPQEPLVPPHPCPVPPPSVVLYRFPLLSKISQAVGNEPSGGPRKP